MGAVAIPKFQTSLIVKRKMQTRRSILLKESSLNKLCMSFKNLLQYYYIYALI